MELGTVLSPLSEDVSRGGARVAQPGLALLCLAVEAEQERKARSVASSSTDSDKHDAKVKRPWLAEEDKLLQKMVQMHGPRHWTLIAESIPGRTGKQARERWLNQLNPDLRKKNWTAEEDRIILEAHAELGNKWSSIAKRLDGRTDNSVKNRFNSTLKRMATSSGTHPGAGEPTTDSCSDLASAGYSSEAVPSKKRKRDTKSPGMPKRMRDW